MYCSIKTVQETINFLALSSCENWSYRRTSIWRQQQKTVFFLQRLTQTGDWRSSQNAPSGTSIPTLIVCPICWSVEPTLVFWVQADWPRKMTLIFLACSRSCQLECLQRHYSQHQQILFKDKMFVTIVTIQSWDRKQSCNLTCLSAAFLPLLSSPNPIPFRDRVSSQTDKNKVKIDKKWLWHKK